ncbi:MAG: cardiolipin synthase [Planctomycetaceae bacterium]
MDSWGAYLSLAIGYLGTLLLIRWVVLTHKRQPVATVAWILSIILLPILGGVLFLFFGINRVARRKRRMEAASRTAADSIPNVYDYDYDPATAAFNDTQRRMMRLAMDVNPTRPTPHNDVELLIDTNIATRRIEEAILQAQSSLHLEYYIWKPDVIGLRIRDLLIERAKAGVTIRFLYDSIGSFGLSRQFLNPMRDAGIHVHPFLPGQTLRERWSINLRTHRKIVVADGRVAFTGGMNIGDEYLGRNRRLGYWRDTHMRMSGPIVLQLQRVFAEDWFYATREDLSHLELYPQSDKAGTLTAQVISGGPVGDVRAFHSLMFAAINEARERITLATSFFVPTDALAMALETAALRGVDVRLLVAGKSEHPWTVYAGRSYYDPLLNAGAEIHEYRRGILHSKTLTIDGCWSLVGSPNFDARSLILNFEVGVVVYDSGFAAELESHYQSDIEHARAIRVDDWCRRPLRHVFRENLCRLFSPVM